MPGSAVARFGAERGKPGFTVVCGVLDKVSDALLDQSRPLLERQTVFVRHRSSGFGDEARYPTGRTSSDSQPVVVDGLCRGAGKAVM
ncbi:hypothetical protein GCM10027063_34100 [Promicromonospora xylanilytica]